MIDMRIFSIVPVFFYLLAMLAVSGSASASQFDIAGICIYVDDGDTVTLLDNKRSQHKIRLSSIDAPETAHTSKESGRIGQPYSINSGAFLKSLIKGKNVVAHCFEVDKYGRDICELFVDGESVNRRMVREGWAWANNAADGKYLRDKAMLTLETDARSSNTGLWGGVSPVAPWEWRKTCWKKGVCRQ